MTRRPDDALPSYARRLTFWLVPPAFDLNPSHESRDLSLAINEVETRCDVSIALEACGDYGLSRNDAGRIVREVREAVAHWRTEAEALGVPRWQQEEMAPCFGD